MFQIKKTALINMQTMWYFSLDPLLVCIKYDKCAYYQRSLSNLELDIVIFRGPRHIDAPSILFFIRILSRFNSLFKDLNEWQTDICNFT